MLNFILKDVPKDFCSSLIRHAHSVDVYFPAISLVNLDVAPSEALPGQIYPGREAPVSLLASGFPIVILPVRVSRLVGAPLVWAWHTESVCMSPATAEKKG